MRVLIVEDEPLIAMSLSEQISQAGHTVLGPASSSAEALELAEEAPTMALVDIDLECKLAGVSVVRELKYRFRVPAFFVTGQRECAAQNADAALGVISKPFELSDIPQALEVAAQILRGGTPPPPSIPSSLQLFGGAARPPAWN